MALIKQFSINEKVGDYWVVTEVIYEKMRGFTFPVLSLYENEAKAKETQTIGNLQVRIGAKNLITKQRFMLKGNFLTIEEIYTELKKLQFFEGAIDA